jgi:hypothetical protein
MNFIQIMCGLCLFMLFLLPMNWVMGDEHASTGGKLLGGVGVVLLTAGLGSVYANIMGLSEVSRLPETEAYRALFEYSMWVTLFLMGGGGALIQLGVGSWVFTPEENRAAREAYEKAQEDERAARKIFHPQGTLVTVRNHVEKGGLLSSTERFTEIETTLAVFVVEGEVRSATKGVMVYRNGRNQLRIGDEDGRTFYLR